MHVQGIYTVFAKWYPLKGERTVLVYNVVNETQSKVNLMVRSQSHVNCHAEHITRLDIP